MKDGKHVPPEYWCPMRGSLRRGYFDLRHRERQIWYIDKQGSNVPKALRDARRVLLRDGLPWFSQFDSPIRVYRILASRDVHMQKLWGFGRPGSPAHVYDLGYAARAAGYTLQARRNLLQAAQSGRFDLVASRLRKHAQKLGTGR